MSPPPMSGESPKEINGIPSCQLIAMRPASKHMTAVAGVLISPDRHQCRRGRLVSEMSCICTTKLCNMFSAEGITSRAFVRTTLDDVSFSLLLESCSFKAYAGLQKARSSTMPGLSAPLASKGIPVCIMCMRSHASVPAPSNLL